MNILQLSEDFYPRVAGGAFEDWEFAKYAASKGDRVVVCTKGKDDWESLEKKAGVEIHRPYKVDSTTDDLNSITSQISRLHMAAKTFLYILSEFDNGEFDVVYSTNHLFHPFAKLLGLIYRSPVVNNIAYSPSINEEDQSLLNPLYIFEQLNFRLFMGDAALTRTPIIQDEIERKSPCRVQIVHGIVNEKDLQEVTEDSRENIREKFDIGSENQTIVFVGRFSPLKRPTEAVKILSQLPRSYKLIMVGDGDSFEDVVNEIDTHGLFEDVNLLGELNHTKTLSVIAESDALILTSKVEAYPTVVFEALCLGIPVVAPPIGILSEIQHPNLHLCSVNRMPEVLKEIEISESCEIDSNYLNKYSIDNFTRSVRMFLQNSSR